MSTKPAYLFTGIAESEESSGSADSPGSSVKSEENDESGESESGESRNYKRNYISRDSDETEDDDGDSEDAAEENSSNNEDSSDGEEEGSAGQGTSKRGKVITDTMGDFAKAAMDDKIERKSDIEHSLPQNTEEAPVSDEEETKTKKNGAALKNLFTALADGEAHASGSGEELAVKDKSQDTIYVKQVSPEICNWLSSGNIFGMKPVKQCFPSLFLDTPIINNINLCNSMATKTPILSLLREKSLGTRLRYSARSEVFS